MDITWNKDHKSNFSLNWIQSQFTDTQRHIVKWDKSIIENIDPLDYSDVNNNETSFQKCLELIDQYGIAFITNCPSSPILEKFAEKFGPIKTTIYGKTWSVLNDPTAKNIAYTNLSLPLHQDLQYLREPPGLQFLQSLKNTCKTGETTFLDSQLALEYFMNIHSSHVDILKTVLVRFTYDNDNHYHSHEKPMIEDTPSGPVLNYAPPFQGVLSLRYTSDEIEKWYAAFNLFEEVLKIDGLVFERKLNQGDLVVFANRRVLHGRRSFEGDCERLFQGAYTEWDDFLDRLVVSEKSRGI